MIRAYVWDGKLTEVSVEEAAKAGGNRWIDVTNITKEEASKVSSLFSLHDLTVEDFVNANVRIKVEEFNEYLFFVTYTLKNKELFELDLVIGDKIVITNHRKPLKFLFDMEVERLGESLSKGCDFLFHHLVDLSIDNFEPSLQKLDEKIERLQDDAADMPKPEVLNKIISVKKSVVGIKRHAFPLREKIGMLAKGDSKYFSKKCKPYFRDVYDHTIRVTDTVDTLRENVSSAYETYMSSMSNKMNEVMKTLSVIATIALPLSVISGIWGTNFLKLPGAEVNYGFWWMIGSMVALVVCMLWYFKKKSWF